MRNIYVFYATNSEKISGYMTASSSWFSPALYGGRLYVGNNDWNVYCFSATVAIEPLVDDVTDTAETDTI